MERQGSNTRPFKCSMYSCGYGITFVAGLFVTAVVCLPCLALGDESMADAFLKSILDEYDKNHRPPEQIQMTTTDN